MPRPSTEAEYLASLIPPSVRGTAFNRRTLFRGALGLTAAAGLAACGGGGDSSSGGGGGGGGGEPPGPGGGGAEEGGPPLAQQVQGRGAGLPQNSGGEGNNHTVGEKKFHEKNKNKHHGS